MWVSKRVYQDLLAAHKREIDILAAWVEQLQAQVGAVGGPRANGDPPKLAEHPDMKLYISSEQEDLFDAHAQGLIDDLQFEQGMAELDRNSTTIG